MKPKTLLSLVLSTLFCLGLTAQTVNHSLIELERVYSPFFTGNSSIIRLDFVQSYTIEEQDTSYSLTVSVNEKSVEVESFSLGSALFSSGGYYGGATGSSVDFSIKKTNGLEVLNYEEFMEIYECISQVFTFITSMEIKSGQQYNTVATCDAKNLLIGVEYVPKKMYQPNAKYNFYFRISGATFSLKREEFQELASTIRKIKELWNQKLADKA